MDRSIAAGSDDLRESLAAERTLLAWIRTGLALMGFVVARFGPFLSLWLGTALIRSGVVVNLVSVWHHLALMRLIDTTRLRQHSTTLAVALALFLAFAGLMLTIYLALQRSRHSGVGKEPSVSIGSDQGIVNTPGRYSVDDTVDRFTAELHARGITLFAVVDHSGEAAKVGIDMRPTRLLIFGSPKAGSPVMIAAPSSAIDLPLKLLVWQDEAGKVWISYNSPTYLQQRHQIPAGLLPNLAVIETLVATVAE
jgi:uncharacterized protein (DUF302 family)/uncharacterized membrane protein YidH (DUF202 family)